MAPAVPTYAPRDSGDTVLYKVIAEHLETFLASCHDDPEATGLPIYVQQEFDDYLRCGILAHGFLRLGCDTCHKELLVPFSCKRRGFCPSCAGRRMAQMAAHLVEQGSVQSSCKKFHPTTHVSVINKGLMSKGTGGAFISTR